MKTKSFISVLILFTFLFAMAGCASKTASSPSASVSKETIFALYNQVQLDQTKEQIDAILGGSGKVSASYDKCYNYMDKNHEYGVAVVYDDNKQAISKTVIYQSHKDIAPFTSKAVTEEQADKIKDGISYDETKTILGGEGVEVSATEIPFENNKISYMYRWANQDGSCVQVVKLVNGTVGSALYFEE